MAGSKRNNGNREDDLDTEFREMKEALVGVLKRSEEQERRSVDIEGTLKKFMEEMRSAMANLQKLPEKQTSEAEVAQKRPIMVEVGETSRRPVVVEESMAKRGVDVAELINDGNRRELGLGFRRLELPLFSGDEPLSWVAKVERYFLLNMVGERDKVTSAILCFEGRALGWLQYREARNPIHTWQELKAELLERFGCVQSLSPREELINLRQRGTVAEYRDKFEALTAQVTGVSNDWLRDQFLAGLRHKIRAEVKLLRPQQLDQLMRLAEDVESRDT